MLLSIGPGGPSPAFLNISRFPLVSCPGLYYNSDMRLQQTSFITRNREVFKLKTIHYALGILFTFCLIITLLITSVEAVTYWTPGYYEKEYAKYNVTASVHMEMDDLLDVTHEMMAYLRGKRENLHVPTIVDGQPREFFNEREIAHMEDVRGLFLGGLTLRRVCIAGVAVCLALLILLKAKVKKVLPVSVCTGCGLFFVIACGLAALISTDFTKYFIIFHKIFFDNDLWILDARTDLLINIVPEPFFMDTAARIGGLFAGSVLVIFFLCLFLVIRGRRARQHGILFLCIALLTGLFPVDAQAASQWPDNISIQAEGGIVMDADTGTVLYGKNAHTPYYPASITKILTALIVIERCDLDEMVTFSHNAVYNVEEGSKSAGLDEGDVLSVRDCLYALLLQSANESANALAEHVAGSVEAFAELMNARAAALGCQDSHFSNPSGLNDPNHYTSAYDMALIGRAALNNETFMGIDSTLYYDLPPTKWNREGLRIYPGHKMIKKNMPEYYSGALGGKTGYTSLAGNTLVTFARRDGMTLVAVILNGHSSHYTDTKAMLNFGFKNFLTVSAADFDTGFTSVENDMIIGGLSPTGLSGLELDPDMKITVPKDADFNSVTSQLAYDLTASDPAGSIARVQYYWNDQKIGYTYLTVKAMSPDQVMLPAPVVSLAESKNQETSAADGSKEESDSAESLLAPLSAEEPLEASSAGEDAVSAEDSVKDSLIQNIEEFFAAIPLAAWLTAAAILTAGAAAGIAAFFRQRNRQKEDEARMVRRQRRLERLQEAGISTEQFEFMVQQKRSLAAKKNGRISQEKEVG